MCGKRGLWPPYLRGESGYIRIMLQLVKGIITTVEAIKEIDPASIMVHVEATGLSRAARRDLEVLAVEEQRRGFLCYDLLTGRVTHEHPLFSWLVYNGASPDDLSHIAGRAIELDVIGMNFYPQWSTQELHLDKKGRLAYRPTDPEGSGFANLIEDYYHRYKVPIIITETSAHISDELRSRWLEQSVGAIKSLRARGVPVHGYTWFPLFTMIDWRYRFGQGPVEDYRIELGLYSLNDEAGGPRWRPTPLVERMREFINDPDVSVGAIAEPSLKE
jgi:beta-glucosidase/6-phospho-beta-glucosidase/beta-galactosidase